VAQFVADLGGSADDLTVRQLALTEAQALALPTERLEELTNAPADWPQPFKAEVEALDPDDLDRIVTDALTAVFDADTLDTAMAAEPAERAEALREIVDG
jgi:hypothetical protein